MSYDVIIIGAGPGGYVAAIRAAQLGLKTLVVERQHLGGICLNWGCIPTKALLKSAEVYEYAKKASEYGVIVSDAKPDIKAMVKRSRDVAAQMNRGIEYLFRKNKVEWIKGTARVLPGKKVEVTKEDGSKEVISAKHIAISTGARARQLPNLPFDGKRIISYKEAMTLDYIPEKMVVVGAGAIGVEFAYFYSTLGTQVTLVEYMPRIVPLEDADISKELERAFRKQGITVKTNSAVEEAKVGSSGVKVKIKDRSKGKEETVEADVVLVAAGITPNTENIGLEEVGIKKNERGFIIVDEFYRTNVEGYYAFGDVIPTPALAHVASHEGIICMEKIAGKDPHPFNYDRVPACTYCQPEIASVGLTEEQAKEKGYEIKVGKFPFTASGKAKAAGKPQGFVKLIFDARYGELLGAHMIGANVTEMISELVVSMNLETTMLELFYSVHPHPTLSEAIMEAAGDSMGHAIHI